MNKALLYRLYINWAITLLIILIPRFLRTTRVFSAKADSLAASAISKSESAVACSEAASNLADEAWCNAVADSIENNNVSPAIAGSASDYRSPAWRQQKILEMSERAKALFAEAAALSDKAAMLARFSAWRAALNVAPVWAAGASAPWLLHFLIRWIVRKQHQCSLPTRNS